VELEGKRHTLLWKCFRRLKPVTKPQADCLQANSCAAAKRKAEEAVAAAEEALPPSIPLAQGEFLLQEEETCVWMLQRGGYACKMSPQVCV
jgi:hypothetical protein